MTAAISMDNRVLSLWQSSNRLIQHGIDQGSIGAAAGCPVHNQTIETVNERQEIELTFRKGEFRDICRNNPKFCVTAKAVQIERNLSWAADG